MSITRDEVIKIAELAKLHLGESELEAFTAQFMRILDYIEKLKEVAVDGVEPTSHVSLTADFERHIFRPDDVRDSLGTDKAISGAPDSASGQFRVPRVL